MQKSATYRCPLGHEHSYAISLADGEGKVCPSCGANTPMVFSVLRNPSRIDVEVLPEIYRCDSYQDAQELRVGSITLGLSVFDRPDHFHILKTEEGLEYHFAYSNYIGNDYWWFPVAKSANVALAKYAWQEKEKRNEPPLFSQPMETIVRIVTGPTKAECIAACREVALAAEKIHVRLNANLLAWLIKQI